MPARAAKKEQINGLIRSLVAQGKRATEIQETLETRGFKNVKPSRIHYYVNQGQKAGRAVPTPPTLPTGFGFPTAAVNIKRLKDVLDADFLTAEDKLMCVRREIFPSGK